MAGCKKLLSSGVFALSLLLIPSQTLAGSLACENMCEQILEQRVDECNGAYDVGGYEWDQCLGLAMGAHRNCVGYVCGFISW
jgi:hypothetical protein